MDRNILSQFEYERFYVFPSPMAEQDIIQYFTLSEQDKKLVDQKRGSHNRLGFALQLCTLRFLGFVPNDLCGVDKKALNFLAKNLEFKFSDLKLYALRKQTRSDHLLEIMAVQGFVSFSKAHTLELNVWLTERALEHDKASVLLEQACGWLLAKKIIRPDGITTLEKIVVQARIGPTPPKGFKTDM